MDAIKKKQYIIDPKKDFVPLIGYLCPICQSHLVMVGMSEPVLWCDCCKKAFTIYYKESDLTEDDLKDVWGFPRLQKEVKS